MEGISRHVEGAVERDAHGPGQFGQGARPDFVYGTVLLQDADDDAVCPRFPGGLDVALHDLELDRRITKVAAARPDHDLQGDVEVAPCLLHRARTRRGAPLHQIRTQLHAVRTPFLRSDGSLNRFDTDFQDSFQRAPPPRAGIMVQLNHCEHKHPRDDLCNRKVAPAVAGFSPPALISELLPDLAARTRIAFGGSCSENTSLRFKS